MSWLRKEVKQALHDARLNDSDYYETVVERVARAFAERALKAFVPDCSERYFNHSVYEQDRQEALAAADKDEP
jgi:hypothetical protein